MPKRNQQNTNATTAPSAANPTEKPARPGGKGPKRDRADKPGLVPEGVDSRFWSLWRAHVLAGIGLIAGYPMGFGACSGHPENTE